MNTLLPLSQSMLDKQDQFDSFLLMERQRIELKLIHFLTAVVNYKNTKSFSFITRLRYCFLFLGKTTLSTECTVPIIVHEICSKPFFALFTYARGRSRWPCVCPYDREPFLALHSVESLQHLKRFNQAPLQKCRKARVAQFPFTSDSILTRRFCTCSRTMASFSSHGLHADKANLSESSRGLMKHL